jgi:hypothetical protein
MNLKAPIEIITLRQKSDKREFTLLAIYSEFNTYPMPSSIFYRSLPALPCHILLIRVMVNTEY